MSFVLKEQLKNTSTLEGSHALPDTFTNVTTSWPELKSLLCAFENRDYGTFMHSVAVHFTASRLTRDLFLLNKTSLLIQQQVRNRAPFWLLHDIGKTAADIDMEVAQTYVHPLHQTQRPVHHKSRHWLHPQMGRDILNIWSSTASPRIQPYAKKWAHLAHLHDTQLLPYLPNANTKNLSWADKFALLIFSLSDTSMAMGLPRPNKSTVFSETQIIQALSKKYLTHQTLSQLFPGQRYEELKQYILASLFHSLRELQNNYPQSTWTQSSKKPDQQKTQFLDALVVQSWKTSEKFWVATMLRMESAGVFSWK